MSQQDEQAEQAVGAFTIAAPPEPDETDAGRAPAPDETWALPRGTAHVFRGQGNTRGIVRPVIVSDGFGHGPSDLGMLHDHLDGRVFPLATELRRRGRDVILLGYNKRSASLLDNAEAVTACITRAQKRQIGDARLVVGGFSMGGLITRYALARMETERIDHRTAVYFSFDSPHRGAVIPVGLQAFAHLLPRWTPFPQQMNSAAARQMLWRHYDPETGQVSTAPERTAFLAALEKVGGWPRNLHRLGLANGRSDGRGLLVPPGDVTLALKVWYDGTTFYTQARGENAVVARLKRLRPSPVDKTVTTSGFPELDGAPGGTMSAFGRIAEHLTAVGAEVDLRHPSVCFIPTVSAVAIRDLDDQDDLYADIGKLPPQDSGLHEFRCSSDTTAHAAVTEELGTWLLDRLPD